MNILLVNDDGINAKGLWALYHALSEQKHNVYVVAPKYNCSALSQAITTREAIRLEKINDKTWAVEGTPADCVLMAFEYILEQELNEINIDLVVSGINSGPNLASDVLYSGTVAAAIEASNYHIKAIAISIDKVKDHKFETAAKVLTHLIEKDIQQWIGEHEILNINVPNIDYEEIEGYTICQTGFSRYQDVIIKSQDGRNREVFWISGNNPVIEISDNPIDTYVLKENKVAISPLKIDYNSYDKIKQMISWGKTIT
jgi:5'-nucleotidase